MDLARSAEERPNPCPKAGELDRSVVRERGSVGSDSGELRVGLGASPLVYLPSSSHPFVQREAETDQEVHALLSLCQVVHAQVDWIGTSDQHARLAGRSELISTGCR